MVLTIHTARFLPDESEIFDEWEKLVDKHGTTGPEVFDARLVAVVLAHGATHFLTFENVLRTRA